MYVRWLMAIVILVLSFGGAYWAGMAARQADKPPPLEVVEGLAVATADLDMGDVWEEKGIALRLPIRNQTAQRIEIDDITQSCGCTDIKPRRLSIAAGETAIIDLTLDLTHRTYSDSGQARRPFEVAIFPVLNPKSQPRLGWKLHGTVVSRVTLDKLAIGFGERPIHGGTPVTQKVVATVHVPCQRLEAAVNPDVVAATIVPRKDDATKFEIVLAANPELPPGKFQADASIFVVSPSGKKTLGATLPLSGIMQPEVRLLPSQLLLEAKPVGETAETVVTLQAVPDAKIAIDHIEIDSPNVKVEPVTVEGIPAGRAFRVRQKVTKIGEQVSEIRFVIRKPNKKLHTLPVRVSCRGEAISTASNTRGETAMNRTYFHLWIFGILCVLISCVPGAAEEIDPRLKKVLADWQKRQNAFRSVRYEVRGQHKVPKGASDASPLIQNIPSLRRNHPIPPKDMIGDVSLMLFLDFERGRHRSRIEALHYHLNFDKFVPVVRESTFDGSVAKGASPRDKNPGLGSKAPEMSIASGNMKTEEFRDKFFPIFFGHGRIYTVFEPIVPGKLRNKPDSDYLYVHRVGVQDGRTCLIVRTQTLKTITTSFEEYWVDTERESAILRHVNYCNSKPLTDITIHYRKLSGGWLPDRWRYQLYTDGSLRFSDTMRVEKLDLDPAVQDSDFQMKIKPGIIVEERTDLPTKHPLATPESKISVYRAKEGGGREELPDPYRRKGDQYQQQLQRKNLWFWSMLALPVLAIGGFYFWARRRRCAS